MFLPYGDFCKYKEGCTTKHLEDIWTDLSSCRKSKNCQKRHPRECKRYSLERFCRFGEGCAYHHKEQSKFLEESDITEINMKVDELKKVAQRNTLEIYVQIFHCVETQRIVRKDTIESVKDIHLKGSACLGQVVPTTTRNSQSSWQKRTSLKPIQKLIN